MADFEQNSSRWLLFGSLAIFALLLAGAHIPAGNGEELSAPQKFAVSLASGAEWKDLAKTNPLLMIRLNTR